MTVVLVPSLRHQLFLLISIFPLLPEVKIEETILRGKSLKKQKERGNIVTKDIRNFFRGSTVAKLIDPLNSKEKKIIKITEESFFFFLIFWLGLLHRAALQREHQISLKRRKVHWKKCNLEFRKSRIKECEWSKIPEKCGIKEWEWWLWFRKYGIKSWEFWSNLIPHFFCSAKLFSALFSSFKVILAKSLT